MHRVLPRCLCLMLFAVPSCFAQVLLPHSISGWKATNSITATPKNLEQIAAANAPVLREYGATGAAAETYTRESGAATFRATIYSFGDPSGAYGAYSFLRTPQMRRAAYSDHSEESSERALILTGNLLLDLTGSDLAKNGSAIKSLAANAAMHAQQGVYPFLPMQLPAKDLIPHTDRYFLGPTALAQFWTAEGLSGDWLGFSRGAEAEVAKYHLKSSELTLLLADYPTPQIAASQMEKLSRALILNQQSEPEKPEVENRIRTKVYGRRDGTLLALVAGAPTQADADKILDQIRSSVIVTWNEPASRLHEPSMADIVVGTIIGTGEMCLIAILIGVVFSGVRLGIKKVLPGRVFDRPQQMEILQLGLSSKPIKAKDFY